MSCKNIYITTPIYYVNDVAHIGHAYTTIIADAVTKYSKLLGYRTFLLTGTDEHGQKIEQSAKKNGKSPKEYADEISDSFRKLWDDFKIEYDYFIRTTDENHKSGVQFAFKKMLENGDIYKDKYSGNYCVSCEAFFTDTQLIEGVACPDCGKVTSVLSEESYFFRLSNYTEKLLTHYRENPDFILPHSKRNEVIAFVENGLKDLSVTRTSFDWGVKLPAEMNEPHHVLYVWLDALLNYATALGYGTDNSKMEFWQPKLHLVGKDILRFHAIYWPAFLMSLGLKLPDHIGAHGWWTRDGQKMSKSIGNVVKPRDVVETYGLDPFRYFLLREVPFGQDGDFSEKALINRINGDLSNSLGNLLNRLLGMAEKYFDFKFSSKLAVFKNEEIEIEKIISRLEDLMFKLQIHKYLEDVWEILAIGNRVIQNSEPWKKIKTNPEQVESLLDFIANLLAKVSILLYPIIPDSSKLIAKSLGIEISAENYDLLIRKSQKIESFNLTVVPPLFPKFEPKIESNNISQKNNIVQNSQIEENLAPLEELSGDGLISIDQFKNVSMRVGKIVSVDEVAKSKKLYKLRVDLGESRPRQIIAGIREFYSADELLNSQVCVVANLQPAKLMGLTSEGMILAVKDNDGLSLVRPERERKNGSKLS